MPAAPSTSRTSSATGWLKWNGAPRYAFQWTWTPIASFRKQHLALMAQLASFGPPKERGLHEDVVGVLGCGRCGGHGNSGERCLVRSPIKTLRHLCRPKSEGPHSLRDSA